MLRQSASSFPPELWAPRRRFGFLKQVDNVGQNDQAYDGKEHQDENIQHCGVLGRGRLWIPRKCEHGDCSQWREMAPLSLYSLALLSPSPLQCLRLRDTAAPSAAYYPPPCSPPSPNQSESSGAGNQGTARFRPGRNEEAQFLPRNPILPFVSKWSLYIMEIGKRSDLYPGAQRMIPPECFSSLFPLMNP